MIALMAMKSPVFSKKQALLLDMNSTFMFGEDRFNDSEDYSIYYEKIGGHLPNKSVNIIINDILEYLGGRYPDEKYRNNFPTVAYAIKETVDLALSEKEIGKIVDTFAFHEHGFIPDEYVKALFELENRYTLSVVIDIWSPKTRWLKTFNRLGLNGLFSASSFSSDHGMVKPSPKPFEMVIKKMGIERDKCLVIGDSVRRDLGGAKLAGIDCVLVGGANDKYALACYPTLLDFCEVAK